MSDRGSGRLAILRLAVLVTVLVALGVGLTVAGTDGLGSALERAADSRWGVVAFILAYVILVVLVAPGTIGTVTAALVFGFGTGLLVSLAGASIGAVVAFGVSRAIGREGAVALLGSRLRSVDEFITEREFLSVLVLRLLPVVPFNGFNYAAGLSAVRPSRYVPATVLGILPGTTLTTFTASRSDEPTSPAFLIAMLVTGLALVGSVVLARRFTARRVDLEAHA